MEKCKDCVEYGSEFCKYCLQEEMTTGDAGIPADTKNMGPRSSLFKTYRVLDKRKKDPARPKLLKRFKEIRNS